MHKKFKSAFWKNESSVAKHRVAGQMWKFANDKKMPSTFSTFIIECLKYWFSTVYALMYAYGVSIDNLSSHLQMI